MLTAGNAAKLYCLQLIEEAVAALADSPFRIIDLGCGDGRNFVELLRRRPQIRYIGVEPSRRAADAARRRLPDAEIINSPAYGFRSEPADAVVSFSVLEHVVDRPRYLAAVAANLRDDGRAYLNYDAGHFTFDADLIERAKAAAGRLLARFGDESRYRLPVRTAELPAALAAAGLRVVEEKGFNTDLKLSYRSVPPDRRPLFMERWLAFELELSASGFGYESGIFRTHNLVLTRA